MAQEYTYRFPIGDWSGDGHGKCDWFEVQGDKPIEDVREVHFSCNDKLGFDIGSICSDYEDNTLDETIFTILKGCDITVPVEDIEYLCPYEVLDLWLAILNHLDPSLSLVKVTNTDITINFYGNDDKGRHLSIPGYGTLGE